MAVLKAGTTVGGKRVLVEGDSAGGLTGTLPVEKGGTGRTSLSDTAYSTQKYRAIAAGTSDLTAGSSSLTSGCIYLVYE